MQDLRTVFTFLIEPQTPEDDYRRLLDPLRAPDVGATVEAPGAGPDLNEIVMVVTIVAGAVTTAQALASVVDKVRAWREEARRDGRSINIRIQKPNGDTIDLSTATDREVDIFIIGDQQEHDH